MTLIDEKILQDNPILAEIVRRLVNAFHPECIYLFGSHARGDASQDSDYDLLMIVTTSSLPRYKREQEAFRTLCGVGASKDIIVMTQEEFDRKLSVVTSLPATVKREGNLLYAA